MEVEKYHTEGLENKTFLVTGGAGFIGSNIVEYLLSFGAGKVRVLDNLATGKLGNIQEFMDNPAFEFMEGDIRDVEVCRRAVRGMDYVSHQAALGSVPRSINDPLTTNEVNINGHLNMLVAARDEGVKRMVYAASSSTYGDSPYLPKVENRIGKPLSPYAITKYVNEMYGDIFSSRYGFHTIGLRYFNIFGPKQDPHGAYAAVIPLFFKAALTGQAPTINGDGEQTRDFTYVANAVQANVKAMLLTENLESHEVCNIACGERTSLNELWQTIAEIVGVKEVNPNYGPERQGDVRDSLADISRAECLLGYEPTKRLKDGLSLCHRWYVRSEVEQLG